MTRADVKSWAEYHIIYPPSRLKSVTKDKDKDNQSFSFIKYYDLPPPEVMSIEPPETLETAKMTRISYNYLG